MLFSMGLTAGRARSKRARSNRRNQKTNYLVPALLGTVSVAALAAFGYIAYPDMNTAKPDEMGCYAMPNQPSTTVLVDSSKPHMDSVQGADFMRAIESVYDRMAGNEKLQIINTELDSIGSIPNPVVDVCAPAKTPAELEELGASSTTQAYLDRKRQTVFDTQIAPALEAMASGESATPQSFESPILEQVQSLSRLIQDGDGAKRLILVSDLLQNTQEAQFCHTQGHMPRFEKFKERAYFDRVAPRSLAGVDITVLMLIRPGYGEFCTGEDELRAFWAAYFADAGANVEFIRIRSGAHVASGS